jgi:hypothetical protein
LQAFASIPEENKQSILDFPLPNECTKFQNALVNCKTGPNQKCESMFTKGKHALFVLFGGPEKGRLVRFCSMGR